MAVDVERARERLMEMRRDLEESRRTLDAETEGGDPGELSHLDQHPADSGSVLSDNDREDALREVVRAQRDEIDAALARLDAGTYGRCVECGQQLPDERLQARPEAARCVTCQEKAEAAGAR